MPSTQSWTEYNGASSVTVVPSRTEANWKAIDDSTTAYTASPLNSSTNTNSFGKVQAIVYAGTWNSLSALTYKIDNNAPATGLSIVGSVITAVVTNSQTATGDAAMSTTGLAANFVTSTSPFGAGTTSTTASGTMYANPLRTQLQTLSSYAGGPGDIVSRTITASWTES